jgi:hypothetical protein
MVRVESQTYDEYLEKKLGPVIGSITIPEIGSGFKVTFQIQI